MSNESKYVFVRYDDPRRSDTKPPWHPGLTIHLGATPFVVDAARCEASCDVYRDDLRGGWHIVPSGRRFVAVRDGVVGQWSSECGTGMSALTAWSYADRFESGNVGKGGGSVKYAQIDAARWHVIDLHDLADHRNAVTTTTAEHATSAAKLSSAAEALKASNPDAPRYVVKQASEMAEGEPCAIMGGSWERDEVEDIARGRGKTYSGPGDLVWAVWTGIHPSDKYAIVDTQSEAWLAFQRERGKGKVDPEECGFCGATGGCRCKAAKEHRWSEDVVCDDMACTCGQTWDTDVLAEPRGFAVALVTHEVGAECGAAFAAFFDSRKAATPKMHAWDRMVTGRSHACVCGSEVTEDALDRMGHVGVVAAVTIARGHACGTALTTYLEDRTNPAEPSDAEICEAWEIVARMDEGLRAVGGVLPGHYVCTVGGREATLTVDRNNQGRLRGVAIGDFWVYDIKYREARTAELKRRTAEAQDKERRRVVVQCQDADAFDVGARDA